MIIAHVAQIRIYKRGWPTWHQPLSDMGREKSLEEALGSASETPNISPSMRPVIIASLCVSLLSLVCALVGGLRGVSKLEIASTPLLVSLFVGSITMLFYAAYMLCLAKIFYELPESRPRPWMRIFFMLPVVAVTSSVAYGIENMQQDSSDIFYPIIYAILALIFSFPIVHSANQFAQGK